ncbi:RbtT/DalT/CsbX family MFS transporter [Corynebacterium uberis]|uniref:RbtT/DalT/CsbX family MFS transporter n=1 Tax=Corynebacterium TaxID=1716 RepID=UPI001D0B8C66|nr:RbtT/DalT/CsbX family MFS transporter [Corynebacterium uberis]MCZ9308332.1 RbtT/DalT/CsbX family MFS transporter [Corynebacterium sp. c6VSa_13]UDL74005.1 RbtT/DalT/CsbX family MFS transporter [Corynebacterium uberis]UDL75111.1 RbtT/DalT/CsbX family MFS transporter [Corynebacterium uberis]UDL77324.1 RbtT/DalT/CsbX family MFS transporter [Corynebacterium uberis]UDL79608.1 RbtT/DalT/CsbX family MFS transporter [Corynebacterium uberis]
MSQHSLTERLGIPRPLIWGFVGLTVFMIGDGIETNILEPFLEDDHGFSVDQAAAVVTVYGIAVAIAAFFAAALSDLWGPRKVMMLGAAVWVCFEVGFLALALTSDQRWMIFLFYGLRGFGYPFFAYGFLVWITATASPRNLASGVGWFYVAFSAGLPTLGALVATVSLNRFHLTYYETLWLSLVVVSIGALIAFVGVRERIGRGPLVEDSSDVTATLARGFKLLATDRRARFVTYIRTINSMPTYAMAIFFPPYFAEVLHWPRAWFLLLTTVIYAVNLPFNPIFGRVGDRFGWWRTMVWAGPVSCFFTLGLVYFTPKMALAAGASDHLAYGLTLIAGALFGVALAGYVPLSPIAVSLDPTHPGAAMSTYNLGVGAAVAAGPLLVYVFHPLLGPTGLILIMMGLFVLAGMMCLAFKGLQPGFDGVPPLTNEHAEAAPQALNPDAATAASASTRSS